MNSFSMFVLLIFSIVFGPVIVGAIVYALLWPFATVAKLIFRR